MKVQRDKENRTALYDALYSLRATLVFLSGVKIPLEDDEEASVALDRAVILLTAEVNRLRWLHKRTDDKIPPWA